MRRAVIAFSLTIILAGCAAYSLIEPRRTTIGDLYTVDPQIPWSSTSDGKVERWTVDGPTLQVIRFVKGLDDGEVLFKGKDKEKTPKFKKHMTPTDIMEFVIDSVTLIGAQKVETRNLRPEKFGNAEGFRCEMRFVSAGGIEYEGFIVGAVINEKLHLIMYTGTKAHFYFKHKDHVERIIGSIRFQKE